MGQDPFTKKFVARLKKERGWEVQDNSDGTFSCNGLLFENESALQSWINIAVCCGPSSQVA